MPSEQMKMQVLLNVEVTLSIKETREIPFSPIFGVEEAGPLFSQLIGHSTVEKLAVLCLNSAFFPMSCAIIGIGTENAVSSSISELVRVAILSNSSKIIIAHNHPSLLLEPSDLDLQKTREIASICKLIGIELVDSIVVNALNEVRSMRLEISKKGVSSE